MSLTGLTVVALLISFVLLYILPGRHCHINAAVHMWSSGAPPFLSILTMDLPDHQRRRPLPSRENLITFLFCCKRLGSPDVDRKYPGGTVESAVADLEALTAAGVDLPEGNLGVRQVLNPAYPERRATGSSEGDGRVVDKTQRERKKDATEGRRAAAEPSWRTDDVTEHLQATQKASWR
ncbi:hypothetical protein NDU88_003655 [Pleurodeles waltl]|uniref:Uncharacterized protein n=1 Tax=Pleurodeles waltl TaxID=8319 RepID=A0AAV7KVG8_PLEWA|nr:hypothetical protein NDU88_003655 [Pleurodeles waltl]